MTNMALKFLEIYNENFFNEEGGAVKALIICLVAILIVFLVLTIIIAAIKLMQVIFGSVKNGNKEVVKQEVNKNSFTNQVPVKKNTEIKDDNMMVAALIATIDFANETKEDVRLVSIRQIG